MDSQVERKRKNGQRYRDGVEVLSLPIFCKKYK